MKEHRRSVCPSVRIADRTFSDVTCVVRESSEMNFIVEGKPSLKYVGNKRKQQPHCVKLE